MDGANHPSSEPAWPAGFADLYEQQRQPMVRLAYLVTRSMARAEEIVQDCFMSVVRRWESIDVPAAYLRTIVVRAAVKSKRRREREDQLFHREPFAVAASPSEGDPAIDDMRAALASLPPKQRAVLVLRFYEDCSHEQIARALGCSVGAARILTHRALNSLRKDVGRWIVQ